MTEKFCLGVSGLSPSTRGTGQNHGSHQVALNELCVHIVILRSRLYLENNLKERAGEVLDEDYL